MTHRLEILDGMTPVLEQIYYISREASLEMLSKSGDVLRKSERSALQSFSHHWMNEVGANGKRKVFQSPSKIRRLGTRTAISSLAKVPPESMANFITSYMMENALTVVVGGKHPRSQQIKRQDGERVGVIPLFGVSKGSIAILDKLAFGKLTADYKRYARSGSFPGFQGAKYVARDFPSVAFASAQSTISDMMTTRLAQLVGKQVNRVTVQEKRIVV